MQFICLDCGHIFEDGEEKRWTEPHGEHMTGCPVCSGGFVEAKYCDECGKAVLEDDLFGGYCMDCLKKTVTCDMALQYFEEMSYFEQFMFEKFFEMPVPNSVSEKMYKTLYEWFLRTERDNQIRGITNLLDMCVEFIFDDDGEYGCDTYADWLKGRVA